jgi:tetratricopeptide (TPR) repeat protein
MLAHTLAHNGMDLADEIGAPRPIAYAKEVLGLGAYVRGDLDEAKSLFQEAMLIFQKINDRRNFASLMVNLARTAYRQGNRDKAWHYLRKSRSICQELEIHWTKSFVLEIMGLLEREAGHYDRAMQLILESLHLSTQQANQQGIANCLGALAGMAALLNQPERAARLFAATEKLRMEMGAKMGRDDQREYERYLSMLRDQMDLGEFEAAWSEGSFMTTEEIIGDFKVFGGESALSHTNFKSKNPHRTTNHDRGHAGRAYAHRVRPCTVPGPPEVAEPGHIS